MITKKEAITFLVEHQPMPCDEDLGEEIKMYEEVRQFFLGNPDEQCIPLFLNSFGGKDGLGVYQMVEDVILMYDKKVVLPHVLDGLRSVYEGVKYWCIQIASDFPDESLYEPLSEILESDDDEDIKMATITSLAQLPLNGIKNDEVIELLRCEMETSGDDDIRDFIEEILSDIQENLEEK